MWKYHLLFMMRFTNWKQYALGTDIILESQFENPNSSWNKPKRWQAIWTNSRLEDSVSCQETNRLSGRVGRHVRSYLPSVMFTILSLRRQFKIHLMKQKVRSQFFILGKTHLKLVMMRMMAEMTMQQPRTRFQQILQPQAHLEQLWWLKDKTRLTKYIYCVHWGFLQWKSELDTWSILLKNQKLGFET